MTLPQLDEAASHCTFRAWIPEASFRGIAVAAADLADMKVCSSARIAARARVSAHSWVNGRIALSRQRNGKIGSQST